MASISIPDSPVSDLLNELLVRDIIPQNKVEALKRDCVEVVDPLILMDLRHKEIEVSTIFLFIISGDQM